MVCLNIAHRGGAGLRPENSLAAFRHAVALGADGAELDVQLSRDGEVIVFHDFRLKPEICRDGASHWITRPTPRIKDLTLAELRHFDIGRADPSSDYARAHGDVVPADGARIPLLAEVIEVAKTAATPFTLFVELKTSFAERALSAGPEELAEATLRVVTAKDYLQHCIFVGFDWPGLLHVKKIAPHAQCWFTTLDQSWFDEGVPPPESDPPAEPALTMLRHWANTGTSPWASGFDAVNHGGSIVRAIRAAGGDGWFPPYRDAVGTRLQEARALGLNVGAWTVNRAEDMRAFSGLDALCTDRPDVLKSLHAG